MSYSSCGGVRSCPTSWCGEEPGRWRAAYQDGGKGVSYPSCGDVRSRPTSLRAEERGRRMAAVQDGCKVVSCPSCGGVRSCPTSRVMSNGGIRMPCAIVDFAAFRLYLCVFLFCWSQQPASQVEYAVVYPPGLGLLPLVSFLSFQAFCLGR